ncbi:MAG: hypothetical protein ABL867_09655 [Rickettsiales bacterium]
MAKTLDDYIKTISESNSPDKEELVKLVKERGEVINRSGNHFLRINDSASDKASGAEKRLETARKVSAALGGEEVQLIDEKKIPVKASAEEVAAISKEKTVSAPEKGATKTAGAGDELDSTIKKLTSSKSTTFEEGHSYLKSAAEGKDNVAQKKLDFEKYLKEDLKAAGKPIPTGKDFERVADKTLRTLVENSKGTFLEVPMIGDQNHDPKTVRKAVDLIEKNLPEGARINVVFKDGKVDSYGIHVDSSEFKSVGNGLVESGFDPLRFTANLDKTHLEIPAKEAERVVHSSGKIQAEKQSPAPEAEQTKTAGAGDVAKSTEAPTAKKAGGIAKGLKSIAILPVIGGLVDAISTLQKTGEIENSNLPTEAKTAAIAHNVARTMGGFVDVSAGASIPAQELAREALIAKHGEGIKGLLIPTDRENLQEASEVVRLDNAKELAAKGQQYRQEMNARAAGGKSMDRAMEMAKAAGCTGKSYECVGVDQNLVKANQLPKLEVAGRNQTL